MEPKVIIIKNVKIPKIIVGIMAGLVLLAVLIFVLDYSKITSFFSKSTTPTPTAMTESVISDKIILHCPVSDNLCQKGVATFYEDNESLIFDLPEKTKVLTMAQVTDLKTQPSVGENVVKLFLSTTIGSNCYTMTYILPSDSVVEKTGSLPLSVGSIVATIGSKNILTDLGTVSLIVQLQQKSSSAGCIISSQEASAFGTYQLINPNELTR